MILFTPFGMPLSASSAISSSFAITVPVGGLPVSAARAEYVQNYTGPTGPVFRTISASIV